MCGAHADVVGTPLSVIRISNFTFICVKTYDVLVLKHFLIANLLEV